MKYEYEVGVLRREAGEGSGLLFSHEGDGKGALIKMKVCIIMEMRWGSDRRSYSVWDTTTSISTENPRVLQRQR